MNNARTQFENRYVADYVMQNDATFLSAATITGDQVGNMQEVCNMNDETLGRIQDVMLDMNEGRIRYAVLSTGGFLGMGRRLFAIPWEALKRDTDNKCFKLDMGLEDMKEVPGFDKKHWPNMADTDWN